MKNFLQREGLLLFLAFAPLIYLSFIYPSLPDKINIHYNAIGSKVQQTNKADLFIIVALITWLPNTIFAALSFTNIGLTNSEGNKKALQGIRLWVALILLCITLIYLCQIQGIDFIQNYATKALAFCLCFAFNGVLILCKNTSPNEFMGIRTPWTLASEENWRKTHQTVAIGLRKTLVVQLFILLVSPQLLSLVLAILCPILISAWIYKKLKDAN